MDHKNDALDYENEVDFVAKGCPTVKLVLNLTKLDNWKPNWRINLRELRNVELAKTMIIEAIRKAEKSNVERKRKKMDLIDSNRLRKANIYSNKLLTIHLSASKLKPVAIIFRLYSVQQCSTTWCLHFTPAKKTDSLLWNSLNPKNRLYV